MTYKDLIAELPIRADPSTRSSPLGDRFSRVPAAAQPS